MGWEGLIVPVIVVAVWIVSTLIRNAEQAKGAGQRKPEKVTDLDRFLREVRRRQGQAREPERPRPAEREEEAAPAERRPEPPRAKWRTPQEEILTAIPVEEAAPAAPLTGTPVMAILAAPPLPVMPADRSARSLPPRPEPVELTRLRELLRSREGLRQAMILREVLGPPLARRRP